jgi:hypothetical protein
LDPLPPLPTPPKTIPSTDDACWNCDGKLYGCDVPPEPLLKTYRVDWIKETPPPPESPVPPPPNPRRERIGLSFLNHLLSNITYPPHEVVE